MSQWQQYPNLPWLEYAACGCKQGGYYARDTRTGEEFHVSDWNTMHQLAADRSGRGARVPLGDMVHGATQKMGLKRCGSCAKRQTFLNRLFG